jgi:type III pantothenate kinase
MHILGDIGNSETKVYLVNSKNKIIRNINFSSKKINDKILNQKFKYLIKDLKSIKKVLFCSVVPKSFNIIKKFLSKKN